MVKLLNTLAFLGLFKNETIVTKITSLIGNLMRIRWPNCSVGIFSLFVLVFTLFYI